MAQLVADGQVLEAAYEGVAHAHAGDADQHLAGAGRVKLDVLDGEGLGRVAQYGSLDTAHSLDTAGIQSAALNAAKDMPDMTAVVVRSCQCLGGATVSCGGSCAGGGVQIYVKVTTQITRQSMFSYRGLAFPGVVSNSAMMRAQ